MRRTWLGVLIFLFGCADPLVVPDAFVSSDAGRDTPALDAFSNDAAPAIDAGADGGADSAVSIDCSHTTVMPAADATHALQQALNDASLSRIGHVPGVDAAHTEQGRVYLMAGVYGLGEIDVPSNVRLEIEPGATLMPIAGATVVFQLGVGDGHGNGTAARNVTITAGDGCSGAGTSVSRAGSEITSTAFRGNDPITAHTWTTTRPTRGMTNATIPFSTDWPVSTMWTFDLDPRATGADEGVRGFSFVWAEDVRIERVFSIQNAERFVDDDPSTGDVDETNMLVAGITSRSTVMMFSPLPLGTITDIATARINRRVSVAWHYDVLAPPGQGPNQIRSCIDCDFQHVFSHGGVALRPETDGVRTSCAMNDCSCAGEPSTGPPNADGSLQGFLELARVDGLTASYIEGVHGNASVQFNPHCLSNGTGVVTHVRGTDQQEGVVVAGPANGAPGEAQMGGAGSFSRVTISDIVLLDGMGAQDRTAMPGRGAWRGYDITSSVDAIERGVATYPFALGDAECWPAGLPSGDLAHVAGTYTITHTGCATSF